MKYLRIFKSTTSLVSVFGCATIALGIPAHAADTSWLPTAASTDWLDGANWSAGLPDDTLKPDGKTDLTTIDGTGANSPILEGVGKSGRLAVGGFAGPAKLTIQNGGTLQSFSPTEDVTVGDTAGSDGTVTVEGQGSRWDLLTNTGLIVGNGGTGKLEVSDGGKVFSPFGGVLGFDQGVLGTATVDGVGSEWNVSSSYLYVGNMGTGSLVVSHGGKVTSGTGSLGVNQGSEGTVTIDGVGSGGVSSMWNMSSTLSVGVEGTGTLSVVNGGKVTSGDGEIGFHQGSNGTVTIDGVGSGGVNSMWDLLSSSLLVGVEGTGTLSVVNGGKVTSGDGEIGSEEKGNGTVKVDGAGSEWDMAGATPLRVGKSGTGSLDIRNGGKVTSGDGEIGSEEKGNGTVTIDGAGSEWDTTGATPLRVGTSGTGTLSVINGGKVTSGEGEIGFHQGSNGTVTIDGAGSTWNIDDGAGGGDLTVGSDGTGSLTLKNGGELHAEAGVHVAAHEGSIGQVNIGAAEGDPAAAPGVLSVPSFNFGAGAGSLVFNHTSEGYTFDKPITTLFLSTPGTIKQLAGTTILTGDSSGFSGKTDVSGGVLQVDGRLGGELDVFATLQGIGTVGEGEGTTLTKIESGGTLSPGGAGIGTMTVAGNLRFENKAIYAVNIDAAGKGDLTEVQGTVIVDGVDGVNVAVEAADGSFQPNTTYTILRAKARTGTDALTLSTKLAFLTPEVSWENSDLILYLARNDKTVTSVAEGVDGGSFSLAPGTPNQIAVAGAIDQLNAGNGVYDALMGMSVDDALRTLQLSSGESYASFTPVIEETSDLFVRSLLGRTGGAGAISTGVSDAGSQSGYVETPVMTAATAAISGIVTPKRDPQRVAWFAPIGARGHFEGDGNASETDWTTGGMTAGYEFSEAMGGGDFLGGIAAGYLHTYAKSDENLTSARFDSGQLGFYGRWKGGPVTVSGAIAGGVIQTRTDRQIKVANLDLTAKSTGWSNTLNASTEVSYAVPMGSDFMLSPLATLATAFVHRNSTSESGADAFNLDVDSSSHAELTPGLGVELTHESDVEGGVVSTRIRTVWEHTIGDDVSQTMNFAGADAAQFSVKAPDAARDRLRLGLGITYATKGNWSLFADYEGVFSATDTHHAARAGAKLTF